MKTAYSDGAESGENTIASVGQDAALDATVKLATFDTQARDIASSGDVAHGFHGKDNVDCE